MGASRRRSLHNGAPTGTQGWYFNTRREQFRDPRVREAIGLAFDFEWTNKNVMYSSYKRVVSYFQNTDMEAKGKPGPEELGCSSRSAARSPDAVFGDPYTPPVADGSGSDRTLLKRADELLLAAGCKREGGALKLPNGKPLTIEFLDSLEARCSRIPRRFSRICASSASTRIRASSTPRRYKSRTEKLSISTSSPRRFRRLADAGRGAARRSSRPRPRSRAGSRNLAGVADPVVDALIEKIATAQSRAELNTACRALDRVLRAGHYWVPMWYATPPGSPIGTSSRGPSASRSSAPARPTPGGGTKEKAKKIGLVIAAMALPP